MVALPLLEINNIKYFKPNVRFWASYKFRSMMFSFFPNYSESLRFYNKRKNGKVIFLIPAYLAPEITHLAPRENESGETALKSITVLLQDDLGSSARRT